MTQIKNLPLASSAASTDVVVGDIAGTTYRIPLSVVTTALQSGILALFSSSAVGNGDALVTVLNTLAAGAVATTQHEVNQRELHLFAFCTAAQIASWQAGDLTQDFTVPLQALFDACSSGSGYLGWCGVLPPGRGKITSKLRSKSTYIHIRGAGMWQTQIVYNGVAAGCIVADAMLYWNPTFEDFSIVGDASSGHGIDGSAITSDVYNGGCRRMYVHAGKAAMYFTTAFCFDWTNIIAESYTDHVFRIKMGNTTVMRGCYAMTAAAGKCGYRLAGNIYLDQCNGVDSLGIWGIFGCDTSATDGWQSDFPGIDYPDIQMVNCNVEAFTVAGIIIHQAAKRFSFVGGKLDRSAFSTAYHSIIWARAQSQTNAPLLIETGTVNTGTGQAQGGTFSAGVWTTGGLTNAQFHTAATQFYDKTGQVAAGLVAYGFLGKFYSDAYATTIPFLADVATADVYGDTAIQHTALSPRRLSMQTTRYKTNTLAPVGAGQTIDVTGYSKVIVTPAAAASITKATFTATQSTGSDYARNGELVIEAGNANLTINHTARGGAADTFVLTGGAALPLAAGQIVRFLRSETGNQWQQV